jgi:hypothetical protein
VSIPVNIITLNPQRLTQFTNQLKWPASMRDRIPSSVDAMAPDNPILQTLGTIPLAPGVKGHSIIPMLPGKEIATGNDGVVEYKSAHISGVESEFIVRTGHSCQGHPFTIEELRRILHDHLGDQAAGPQYGGVLSLGSATPAAATPASFVPGSDNSTGHN